MSRGYTCIGLDSPKCKENVGGVLRAACVFDVALIVVANQRFKTLKKFPTDTMRAYKHIPVQEVDNIFDALPYDCVSVAVEILNGATPLPKYTHPERAFYIFGAEDATLGKRITDRCRDIIWIPSKRCLNLAAAVNVVLYDRTAKRDWK